jgi:hypothetical protein
MSAMGVLFLASGVLTRILIIAYSDNYMCQTSETTFERTVRSIPEYLYEAVLNSR